MKQRLKKQDTGFTQINNEVLNDKNLSWKAKGIYCYIYSKPDDWQFSAKRIAQDNSTGLDATKTAIRELEKSGYLERLRQSTGRVIYYINFDKKPLVENPTVGKSHCGKIHTLSNKEFNSNILVNSNKDRKTSFAGDNINDLIALFKKVNPSYERLFPNKTQRSAISRLLKKFGREKVTEIINSLSVSNSKEYAPTITTPLQLEAKLGQLAAYWNKKPKQIIAKV